MMLKTRSWFLLVITLFSVTAIALGQPPSDEIATVTYNGIRFSYRPDIFGAVLPEYDEGTPFQTDAPYFANVAPHTIFHFLRPDPARPDTHLEGQLRVYRTADLAAYAEPSYRQVVEQLQTLDTTDLNAYANVSANFQTPAALPFIPVLNAVQVFRAHPQALTVDNLTGIEYYTYYAQAALPILEGQVMYAYQGMTVDGAYYLSFSMPVEMGLLDTAIPADLDWEAFAADYTPYLHDTYAAISAADTETFVPGHTVLNDFIESISMSG